MGKHLRKSPPGGEHRFSTAIPRLNVVTGKGGVGRTTLAAAMGLLAARRGLRTVIVEVAARQGVPDLFGAPPRGYEPVECAPGLLAVRVTWEDALREYGLMKLHFRTLYRVVFENPLVRRILPAIPGVAEILVIGKVLFVATDGLPGGHAPDVVILDAPATGHGVALFSAPFAVSEAVGSGPLAEDARRLKALLLDSGFTRFHIVATPEEMPVAEGIEIHERLALHHGLPFGPVFLNGVQDHGLTPAQQQALRVFLARRDGADAVGRVARAALFMAARDEMQRAHIGRLTRHVPLPVIPLPDLSGSGGARERVERLADHLDTRLWREER